MGVVLSFYASMNSPAVSAAFSSLSEALAEVDALGLVRAGYVKDALPTITVREKGRYVRHYDLTNPDDLLQARKDAEAQS